MAKIRLTQLAHDYNLNFDTAKEIAFKLLDESYITGKGRNTWINEIGQKILDDNIAMEIKKARTYRGRIRNIAPNTRFAYVHIPEKNGCVPVEIPRKLSRWVQPQKMVYVEELQDDKYVMILPKIV